jgi:hypothetical protein
VNLARFICPSFVRPDSNSNWWKNSVAGHGRENFFKILHCALGLRVVARASREFTVAHGTELPAQRLLGDRDAEFLEDPLRQIDQPPAHHAVNRRNRATLNHANDDLALGSIELGWVARRFAVQETIRTAGVEVQHPVADDLKPDAADLGRLSACRAVIDCRQGEKPTRL